jgi:hypothetical protein
MTGEQDSDVKSLVKEVEADYRRWYERSVGRVGLTYGILQSCAVLSGFIVALLTALVNVEHFAQYKAAVVIVSAIGSVAASILVQFRVHDLLRLREEGRIAFQSLALYGRGRLLGLKAGDEKEELFEEIARRIDLIEKDQSDRFFALVKSEMVGQFVPLSKERNQPGHAKQDPKATQV